MIREPETWVELTRLVIRAPETWVELTRLVIRAPETWKVIRAPETSISPGW